MIDFAIFRRAISEPRLPDRAADRVGERQLVADRTLPLVRISIATGFVSGLLLSPKLWITTRLFPLVPVVHGLPNIPHPIDLFCYGALLVALVAITLAPKPQIPILVFAAFLALYSLWDQTRWQPWIYQYWLMLIALGCSSGSPQDIMRGRDAKNICRLIMGCTYFYSGLQKMNHGFISRAFPWIVETLHIHLRGLRYLGWATACIEISIGLSLLTRRYRTLGIVNGIVMHLFILWTFGPLGRNWNGVVWPWNVVMIALILLLFRGTEVSFADIVWRNRLVYHKVVLILVGVLPSLSFFGWWPSNLSFALYTGNYLDANIQVSEQVKRQDLPPLVQRYVEPAHGHLQLTVQDWALGELNVPVYAGIQSYLAALSAVCLYSNNSTDVVLIGTEKSTLLGRGREIRNTCSDTMAADHRR